MLFLLLSLISLAFSQPLTEPLTLKKLEVFLSENPQLVKIEELLPALPENFRTSPVYLFNSSSRQATMTEHGNVKQGLMNPRAILFSEKSNLILTINSSLDFIGGNLVELIELGEDKEFHFAQITFSMHDRKPPKFDGTPLETVCIGCHFNRRPIWPSYNFWPNAYRGLGTSFASAFEANMWKEFVEGKPNHPRYKHLIESKTNDSFHGYPAPRHITRNYRLSSKLSRMNFENISKSLAQTPKILPYKRSLITGVMCGISQYGEKIFEPELRQNFPLDLGEVKTHVKSEIEYGMARKRERYLSHFEGHVTDKEAQNLLEATKDHFLKKEPVEGQAGVLDSITALKLIGENYLGNRLEDWSMDGDDMYGFHDGGGLEGEFRNFLGFMVRDLKLEAFQLTPQSPAFGSIQESDTEYYLDFCSGL